MISTLDDKLHRAVSGSHAAHISPATAFFKKPETFASY